ncbi:transposon-encoded TnpW family protein [Eggerthia catenaformis]|uniref:transposon-encoded TnpW family protein n=1 Tax=Eggerthia catenaformis TaxID=31973 RepID=UPI001F4C98C7|nr:transposon-encoded TnpW family protein [Eggerthia catenaformis]
MGKVTYAVVVHFNENATETMQDKLKLIMFREMDRNKRNFQVIYLVIKFHLW